MYFSVANRFLSTLDLKGIWLSSPPHTHNGLLCASLPSLHGRLLAERIQFLTKTQLRKTRADPRCQMMLSWVSLAIFSLGFTPVVPFQALIRAILWGSLGTWLAWSIHSPRHHSTNTEWTSIVMWMLENLRTQRQAKCNPCSQGSSLSKKKERAKKIINEQQDTRGCGSSGYTHWFHQGKGTYKALVPVNKLQPLSFKLTFFFFFLILCGAEAGKPTFLLCQVVAALALKMGCPGKPAKLEEGERTCSCLLGHHWFSLSFLFLSASSQPGSCTLAGCPRTSD